MYWFYLAATCFALALTDDLVRLIEWARSLPRERRRRAKIARVMWMEGL